MTMRRRYGADGSCRNGTDAMAERFMAGDGVAGPVRRWRALLPPAQWLPAYRVQWLRCDLIAGVTLAAYAVPVADRVLRAYFEITGRRKRGLVMRTDADPLETDLPVLADSAAFPEPPDYGQYVPIAAD